MRVFNIIKQKCFNLFNPNIKQIKNYFISLESNNNSYIVNIKCTKTGVVISFDLEDFEDMYDWIDCQIESDNYNEYR